MGGISDNVSSSSDSFCDADGSEVSEDMALSTYVAHVKTSSSENKEVRDVRNENISTH